MELSPEQINRALGAVIGSAAGDALGSQYEFGPSHGSDFVPEFGEGIFGHPRGAWTDDTEMAIPILQHLAASPDGVIDFASVGQQWIAWAVNAQDVGAQTRQVLSRAHSAARESGAATPTVGQLHYAAQEHHLATGRSGGNGALMRTGPVALAGFAASGAAEPRAHVAELAQSVARLTHWEDDNVDACVLWSVAIYEAIVTGEVRFDYALGLIAQWDEDRAARWAQLIDDARAADSSTLHYSQTNGWVVSAFQSALSAVTHADSYVEAIYLAIRGGGDTDTVAAITGSLAGAKWGIDQIPAEWQELLHGWPGLDASDLRSLTLQALQQ